MNRNRIKNEIKKIGKDHKRRMKSVISSVLIVGLAIATTFLAGMSPDEEAARLEKESFDPKPAIEYVVDMPKDEIIIGDAVYKKTERVRSKKWSLLSIPMWIIGHIASWLLMPIIGKLLSYVFIAAIFFGILCLCLKTLYPDTPLRELLTGRNILTFVCCTGVFLAALQIPELLDMNTDNYGLFSFLSGALCVLTMILLCSDGKKKKGEEEEETAAQAA